MSKYKLLFQLIIQLLIIAILLLSITVQLKENTNDTKNENNEGKVENENVKIDDFFNKSLFERSLPFYNGQCELSDILKYEKYMNIPIKCNENNETNCFEMIKAGKAIEKHMKEVQTSNTNSIFLISLNKSTMLNSKIGTIYAAFLYSIASKRKLIINAAKDDLFFLRKEIIDSSLTDKRPNVDYFMPNLFSSCCANISSLFNVIEMEEGIWPQVPYLHPELGTRIIEIFGVNAAYYCLNYLFGEAFHTNANPESAKCKIPNDASDAGIVVMKGIGKVNKDDFVRRMKICSYDVENTLILEESTKSDVLTQYCNILTLVSPSATRIVYALGSLTGWLSLAMSGKKGSVVPIKYDSCFDLKLSQSGSIDHLFNPKKQFPYSTNNFFYVCGTNINEARFFKQYLLW